MTPIIRAVPRAVRAGGTTRIPTSRRREILESLRWMQREHVRELGRLGYSAEEAYWLDFACLPFLPWDQTAASEMPLTWILRLYADIYRHGAGSLGSWDEPAFIGLLRQRYQRMKQVVTAANEAPPETPAGGRPAEDGAASEKWARSGWIVLRTARAWQGHHAAFPCRLAENL